MRDAVATPVNEVHVSLATAWELAIKESLGRLRLPEPFEAMLERAGFVLLPIDLNHVRRVTRLVLVSADPKVARYDVSVLA